MKLATFLFQYMGLVEGTTMPWMAHMRTFFHGPRFDWIGDACTAWVKLEERLSESSRSGEWGWLR